MPEGGSLSYEAALEASDILSSIREIMDGFSDSGDAASEMGDRIDQAVSDSASSFSQLADASSDVSDSMSQVSDSAGEMGESVSAGAEQGASSLDGVTSAAGTAGSSIMELVGAGAALAAGFAIVEGVKEILSEIAEQAKEAVMSMAQLEETTVRAGVMGGGSMADMQARAEQYKDVAQEVARTTGATTDEVAQSLSIMAGYGAKSTQLTAQAIEPMHRLSQIRGESLQSATDIVMRTEKLYGKGMEDNTKIADQYALALEKSNLGLDSMGRIVQYTAPYMKQQKTGFEDTLAAVTMLRQQGMDESLIARSFRGAMATLAGADEGVKTEMDKKTKRIKTTYTGAAEGLHDLGINVKDVDLKTHSFLDTLGLMKAHKATIEDYNKVFGKGTGGMMATLADLLPEAKKLSGEFQNASGTAATAAGVIDNTLSSSFARMDESIKVLKTDMAETLKGPIKDFAEYFSGPLYDAMHKVTDDLKRGDIKSAVKDAFDLGGVVAEGLSGAEQRIANALQGYAQAILGFDWETTGAEVGKKVSEWLVKNLGFDAQVAGRTIAASLAAAMDFARGFLPSLVSEGFDIQKFLFGPTPLNDLLQPIEKIFGWEFKLIALQIEDAMAPSTDAVMQGLYNIHDVGVKAFLDMANAAIDAANAVGEQLVKALNLAASAARGIPGLGSLFGGGGGEESGGTAAQGPYDPTKKYQYYFKGNLQSSSGAVLNKWSRDIGGGTLPVSGLTEIQSGSTAQLTARSRAIQSFDPSSLGYRTAELAAEPEPPEELSTAEAYMAGWNVLTGQVKKEAIDKARELESTTAFGQPATRGLFLAPGTPGAVSPEGGILSPVLYPKPDQPITVTDPKGTSVLDVLGENVNGAGIGIKEGNFEWKKISHITEAQYDLVKLGNYDSKQAAEERKRQMEEVKTQLKLAKEDLAKPLTPISDNTKRTADNTQDQKGTIADLVKAISATSGAGVAAAAKGPVWGAGGEGGMFLPSYIGPTSGYKEWSLQQKGFFEPPAALGRVAQEYAKVLGIERPALDLDVGPARMTVSTFQGEVLGMFTNAKPQVDADTAPARTSIDDVVSYGNSQSVTIPVYYDIHDIPAPTVRPGTRSSPNYASAFGALWGLQGGGSVKGPTPAILGEGGREEYVVPEHGALVLKGGEKSKSTPTVNVTIDARGAYIGLDSLDKLTSIIADQIAHKATMV